MLTPDSACAVGMKWVGGMTLIEHQKLSADSACIDFLSIASAYKHLHIEMGLRLTEVALGDDAFLRFNNNSSASYYSVQIQLRQPNSITTQELLSGTCAFITVVPGKTSTPGSPFNTVILDISDYADTTKPKGYNVDGGLVFGTATQQTRKESAHGLWNNASAISQITFFPFTACFAASSVATLYGMS